MLKLLNDIKIFRFGPEPETNLNVTAYGSRDLEKLTLKRDKWTEVACAAEMEIAADEFGFWCRMNTVEEYVRFFSERGDTDFSDHQKLYRYLKNS